MPFSAPMDMTQSPERRLVVLPGFAFMQSSFNIYYIRKTHEEYSWKAIFKIFNQRTLALILFMTFLFIISLTMSRHHKAKYLESCIIAGFSVARALFAQPFEEHIYSRSLFCIF